MDLTPPAMPSPPPPMPSAAPGPVAAPSPWHLGPWADTLIYHWSWVFCLIPLLFLGPKFPDDYLWIALPIIGMNFAHQAVTIPFIYLDGEVFRRDARRLTVLPGFLLAGFLAALVLWRDRWPAASIAPVQLMVAAAVPLLGVLAAALTGGGLHLTRRAGILAAGVLVALLAGWTGLFPPLAGAAGAPILLAAQAALAAVFVVEATRRAPSPAPRLRLYGVGWGLALLLVGACVYAAFVPEAVVPSWPEKRYRFRSLMLPLTVIAYLWNFWHVYRQKYGILRLHAGKSGPPVDVAVPPRIDEALVFGWLPLTIAVLGVSHRAFLLKQYSRMRGPMVPIIEWLEASTAWLIPLCAAFGVLTVGLWLRAEWRATRLRNPARLSAGLGMVALSLSLLLFDPIKAVIAFGFNHVVEYFVFVWAFQRRYYSTPRPTLLARLMKRPAVAVFGFAIVVSTFHVFAGAWGKEIGPAGARLAIGEYSIGRVLGALGMFQAVLHFYVDGFLWKLRRPVVRANV